MLRLKGLQVPGGDTSSDLIPSNPDDNYYDEFAEDNNRKVDEWVYQGIVLRGSALIYRDSSDGGDADEDEEDGEGSQYDDAGDKEDEEDEEDEEGGEDEEDEEGRDDE